MKIPGLDSPMTASSGLPQRHPDPYLPCQFLVEIDGLVVGGFSEVDGLECEIATEEVREGGLNDRIHLLVGPAKPASVLVLRRGLTDQDLLWGWFDDVRHGKVVRRDGTVTLLDAERQAAVWWNFKQACPIKWTGPSLRADASGQVAVEAVELAHLGIERPSSSRALSRRRRQRAAGGRR